MNKMEYKLKIKLPINEDTKELYFGEDTNEWKVVEEGDWIADYKYECSYKIVSPVENPELFYRFDLSRSGSYFTDWYYDIEDLKELELDRVEKKEIVRTEWVYS